jgi:DNA-binding transcriptional ArsR family regulator
LRDGAHRAILNRVVQHASDLDAAFAAIADPTRRRVLERLGRGDASVGDLAAECRMTLTGMKKHLAVLEAAGLVATEKVGRVRRCRLGPRRLEAETAWIANYRALLEARYDRLAEFLERPAPPAPAPDSPAPGPRAPAPTPGDPP